MGAAQHQHVGAGLAQLAHRGFYGGAQGGAFQLAALDQGDPLGAGPQQDAHLGRFTRCTRAANLRLASVPVVANTPITPLAVRWAAGLMAGSTPITIRPGWRARRSAMAAAVAVLQATTMALASRSTK